MAKLFQNKYRVSSVRLPIWDYGANGACFIASSSILPSNNPNKRPNPDSGKTFGQMRFQNQGKHTISAIVGSYKSVVTKNARPVVPDFQWQSRFHDHIIRNASSFERIQYYIANNPAKWNQDKFYE